jgi:imidazole glycerol-phosphate synthase subunit HisH
MITIVDYGMGNLRSVAKAVELYTDAVRISDDPASLSDSSGIIIPGDGAFGAAMENMRSRGWIEPLKAYIAADRPCLGICLGYQLLFTTSEEFGEHEGLGIIPGRVVRFPENGLKVPHMGWNRVRLSGANCYLSGIPDDSYFYFIHSFYPVVDDPSWIVGSAEYGSRFTCMAGKGNLLAAQFHPEKSHSVGLSIIRNFTEAACR